MATVYHLTRVKIKSTAIIDPSNDFGITSSALFG